MSGTYTWPQVVNGKTYAEADFRPYTYATTLPDLLGNFAAQATNAQGAVQAANASASAAAAATSAAQAASRVAGVTTGSTANLVYPEAVANLVTATDVRDVLVYDTRLDSDGGAWTRRCQHTSWWNETLNTATRGVKRDFPTVALIVLRPSGVTFYDLHDLDGSGVPRMWLVMPATVSTMLSSLVTMNGLAALNGRVVIATTNGTYEFGFLADTASNRTAAGNYAFPLPLAQRSVSGGYAATSGGALASSGANDVALRVLPGALRDGAGLPIPTIAVATSGGISVIHPNGQVVSLTDATGHTLVSFVSDTHLSGVWGVQTSVLFFYAIPYATSAEGGARVCAYATAGQALNFNTGGQPSLTADASGGVTGLAHFAHELTTNPANGMVALTSHTYATGWQPGDIRLAALCDARVGAWASDIRLTLDGTSVAGFSSVNSGTVTSTGGRIRVARNGVGNAGGLVGFSGLTVGETYTVDVDGYIGTAGFWFVHMLGNSGLLTGSGALAADVVQARYQFVADATTASLVVYAGTDTGTNYAEFDNITVRAGVADRSYRAKGFHVVGSLSRAAVGTGNDVVAFSGFSSSNYLQQPYNANLDFGSGDFCLTFWGRTTVSNGYYLERDSATTGARISLVAAGNKVNFAVFDGVAVGASVTSNGDLFSSDMALWHFIRRGAVLEVWRNGVLDVSGSIGSVGSLTNTSSILRVGERVSSSNPGGGLVISMLRFSAYAPTPTQIARMWRDERPLFDTGAKALLGGTSSYVSDLSYSEHSRRLAAATADGVAVFSGLRRVEYLNTGNLLPAMASNNASKVALEAGALVVGTAYNMGMRRDAITGLDRMLTSPRAPFAPRRLTARGFTTDATPTNLAPRLSIGERETLIVEATFVGRVYGAADGQRLSYQRRGTYYRDAGGNVTLQGSVQTIGTDTEVTSTADATLVIDTTAQTVAPQVTGVAATRIVWTATLEITRIADAQYEEII